MKYKGDFSQGRNTSEDTVKCTQRQIVNSGIWPEISLVIHVSQAEGEVIKWIRVPKIIKKGGKPLPDFVT